MIIPQPFPDELAITHLFRFLVANNYDKKNLYNEKLALARTLRHLRPANAAHAWSEIHTHAILAHLCGMTPHEYRSEHTLLVLTKDWRSVMSHSPVKESKTDVYRLAELYKYSPSQQWFLRLCPQCRDEDLVRHGMSYWRREHHLPGIDICVTHGAALHQAYFSQGYCAPNPASVHGVEVPAELENAQSHPAIERYRTLLRRTLKNATTVQYENAGEKAKARALDLGVLHHKMSYVYMSSLDRIAEFIVSKLPSTWVRHHLLHDYEQCQLVVEKYSYRAELRRIEHPGGLKPVFLLLILAALFESTDEVCSFLFAEPVKTIKTPESELCDAPA